MERYVLHAFLGSSKYGAAYIGQDKNNDLEVSPCLFLLCRPSRWCRETSS